MGIFRTKTARVYEKSRLLETHKVAPVVDFEADEYSTVMRIQVVNEVGVRSNLEITMGIKQLHQLTNNLYLACRAFNIPIGDPLADRAKGFWGMRP